jgi:hypothetical protein
VHDRGLQPRLMPCTRRALILNDICAPVWQFLFARAAPHVEHSDVPFFFMRLCFHCYNDCGYGNRLSTGSAENSTV